MKPNHRVEQKDRLARLLRALPGTKLDFLLITHLPNIRYLTGFTGSAGALLVGASGATLFTDGRYKAQAAGEVRGTRIAIGKRPLALEAADWLATRHNTLRSSKQTDSLAPSAAGARRKASSSILGIEPESMTAGMRDRLASALRGKVKLRSAPPLVERARMVKDEGEVLRIHEAAKLGCP
jgi:Xaa-Pro aminopeptidase